MLIGKWFHKWALSGHCDSDTFVALWTSPHNPLGAEPLTFADHGMYLLCFP